MDDVTPEMAAWLREHVAVGRGMSSTSPPIVVQLTFGYRSLSDADACALARYILAEVERVRAELRNN